MLHTRNDAREAVKDFLRAEWVFRGEDWICSYCKNRAIKTEGGYFAITHYCGNCGNKMSVAEICENAHGSRSNNIGGSEPPE